MKTTSSFIDVKHKINKFFYKVAFNFKIKFSKAFSHTKSHDLIDIHLTSTLNFPRDNIFDHLGGK